MPYVITTTIPGCGSPCGGDPECERVVESRRAVATLDEARESALGVIADNRDHGNPHQFMWDDAHRCAFHMPEAGGTIGPLPDGTVIQIERVTLDELAERTSHCAPGLHTARMQSGQYKLASVLVNAFNAAA